MSILRRAVRRPGRGESNHESRCRSFGRYPRSRPVGRSDVCSGSPGRRGPRRWWPRGRRRARCRSAAFRWRWTLRFGCSLQRRRTCIRPRGRRLWCRAWLRGRRLLPWRLWRGLPWVGVCRPRLCRRLSRSLRRIWPLRRLWRLPRLFDGSLLAGWLLAGRLLAARLLRPRLLVVPRVFAACLRHLLVRRDPLLLCQRCVLHLESRL